MSYKLKFFVEQEFVPPETYKLIQEKKITLTEIVDVKMLITMDAIREYFKKPITINNWHIGGEFSYRGFRPKDCKVGVAFSQHKQGNAVDFDVEGMTAQKVRDIILKNKDNEAFKFINRMEAGVSWVHIDRKETKKQDRIILFNP